MNTLLTHNKKQTTIVNMAKLTLAVAGSIEKTHSFLKSPFPLFCFSSLKEIKLYYNMHLCIHM